MPTINEYFASLATTATDTLRDSLNPDPAPVVVDGPQDPAATAWSSLAVHPLSVLETSYIADVRSAEQAAPNQEAEREAVFEALSGYFALNKDTPTLLSPGSAPLIDERIAGIKTDFNQIEVLVPQNFGAAYERLKLLIAEVATTLDMITTRETIGLASQHIQDVFLYLDMGTQTTENVAANWAQHNPGNSEVDVQARLQEIKAQIIDPIKKPSIAAASPRSLYNIGPFYLYRLMHRFLGGSPDTEMNLANKGFASGLVTGEMHRSDWPWVSEWHQSQINELAEKVVALEATLQEDFMMGDTAVLKFFLKGGRAMYTVLGSPELGGNDWDTGILINPDLPAEKWYKAFAKVNDLIISFLDKARFSYTELLSQHKDELLNAVPVQLAAQTQNTAVHHYDPNEFSRAAMESEHLESQNQRVAVALGLPTPFLPVGVNGELIDIGVSARNSVELHEHWRAIDIISIDGVGGIPTNVPTLPYFVDDFSTMIRDAIETNTVDRKLAKRLERLLLVMLSDDHDFQGEIAHKLHEVSEKLPNAYVAYNLADESVQSKMLGWGLAVLLENVGVYYLRNEWIAAFDDYLQTNAGPLLNEQSIDELWLTIKPSIKNHAHDEGCKSLFLAQTALATISRAIREDYATKAASLSGVNRAAVEFLKTTIDAPFSLPDAGIFYQTGFMAAMTQAVHQGLQVPVNSGLSLGGAAEYFYRPGETDAQDAFHQLDATASPGIPANYSLSVEVFGGQEMLVLRTSVAIPGLNIAPPNPALMIIRQEPDGVGAARVLDHINGSATASLRDLVRQFVNRAAKSDDFGLRLAGKKAVSYLLGDVLGRQLRE